MDGEMTASCASLLLVLAPALAQAQPAPTAVDDGYCDNVQGTASATAATLFAPQLFAQFGYIEQLNFSVNTDPNIEPNDLRAIGGVRYSFTNILAGKATKARADADCRRHKAQAAMQAIAQQLKDTSSARAIAARLKVYEAAQVEADKLLATVQADVDARRTTTQEAISTRLRVDDLRSQLAQAQRELAALPSQEPKGVDNLLADYREADSDLETSEARLRTVRAYDVNLRAGADRFLNGSNQGTRYFAVVEVGVNLGALWTGSGNKRSAAGRARYARTVGPLAAAVDPALLRPLLEVQQKRLAQVQALSGDLDRQLASLAQAESMDAKRFRETIWFEAIKAKAELAYLQAHVATLTEMLGGK